MSRFDPVALSTPLDKRASQTFLRHMARCPRSAYLYHERKGEAQNDAMARGSAFHAVAERAIKLAVEQGEPMVPPELVKDILQEVLVEFPVPFAEHDFLRELCWRWASEWTIDPAKVVACETLFVLDIGGWDVRCKVDFAELRGETLYVCDWKTGRGAFSYEEIARKRADGTFLPRTFQLVLYALAVKLGRPVEIIGEGEEVVGPPRAMRAQEVIAEFVYPAIEDSEGHMLRRTMGLTALEVSEYVESLYALVSQTASAERDGDWPAVVSDSACSECPAPSQCPIPSELRDHRGTINDVEQARESLEVLDVRRKRDAATRAELKAFAKANDVEIRFGKDKVAKFVYTETERVDKGAVRAAIAAGVPVPPDVFSVGKSTNFKDVKIEEEDDD